MTRSAGRLVIWFISCALLLGVLGAEPAGADGTTRERLLATLLRGLPFAVDPVLLQSHPPSEQIGICAQEMFRTMHGENHLLVSVPAISADLSSFYALLGNQSLSLIQAYSDSNRYLPVIASRQFSHVTKCVLSSGHNVVLFGVAVETGASSATIDQIHAIGQFMDVMKFDSPPNSLWHQDLLSDSTCWEIHWAHSKETDQSVCLVDSDFSRQAENALAQWKSLGALKYSNPGSILAAQAGEYGLVLKQETSIMPLAHRLWQLSGFRNFFHVEVSRVAGRALREIHEQSRSVDLEWPRLDFSPLLHQLSERVSWFPSLSFNEGRFHLMLQRMQRALRNNPAVQNCLSQTLFSLLPQERSPHPHVLPGNANNAGLVYPVGPISWQGESSAFEYAPVAALQVAPSLFDYYGYLIEAMTTLYRTREPDTLNAFMLNMRAFNATYAETNTSCRPPEELKVFCRLLVALKCITLIEAVDITKLLPEHLLFEESAPPFEDKHLTQSSVDEDGAEFDRLLTHTSIGRFLQRDSDLFHLFISQRSWLSAPEEE